MADKNERKYMIKDSWIFNLESMHDKLWCIGTDLDEGSIAGPVEILGGTYTSSYDLQDLVDECSALEWAAKTRKVTSKEYGRIKEIISWRVYQRYATCLLAGLRESDAGACFKDL